MTWQRPDTNCKVVEYFITYEGKSLWSDEDDPKKQISVLGNETTKEITQLIPYSTYTFYILATNDEGNGTVANITLTTLEGSEYHFDIHLSYNQLLQAMYCPRTFQYYHFIHKYTYLRHKK